MLIEVIASHSNRVFYHKRIECDPSEAHVNVEDALYLAETEVYRGCADYAEVRVDGKQYAEYEE